MKRLLKHLFKQSNNKKFINLYLKMKSRKPLSEKSNYNIFSFSLILIMAITFFSSHLRAQDTIYKTRDTIQWCKFEPAKNNVTFTTKSLPGGPLPPNSQITCGSIRVTFMDVVNGTGDGFNDMTFGATRRNCVCNVLSYVQSVIVLPSSITPSSPIDLLFDLSQNLPASSTLGFASPAYPSGYTLGTPDYYGGYLYDYIITGLNTAPPGMEHGKITINFGHSYTYCTPIIGDCDFDFESLILHEFTHLIADVYFILMGQVPIRWLTI
jgi:hypothetical protein